MKTKSVQECIDMILLNINKRRNVDYADKNSVRRYNAAYNQAFKYVKFIDDHYPDSINMLVEFLKSPDPDIVGHIAPMILRLRNSTKEQKEQALEAVREIIASPNVDPVTRLGFSMSLKKWEKAVDDG